MKDLKQLRTNKLAREQIDSQKSLQKQIEALRQAIESQEPVDLTDISDKLTELSERLELEPLFSSLEKSIQVTSQTLVDKTKTPDFSKLLREIEKIKQPINVTTKSDVALEYRASDVEAGDVTSYYGFLHPSGKWYILRQSGATDANFRYIAGVKDYASAWRNRTNHSYVFYDEVKL